MLKKIFKWFFSLIIIATSQFAPAANVTLAWDANPESNIAGYRLYQGVSSGIYIQQIDVGNTTIYTVTNLTIGITYYFALSAYNTDGLESPLSNEIFYLVGSSPSPTPSSPTPTASPNSILIIPNSITFIDPTIPAPYPSSQSIQVITSTKQNWASQDNSDWFNTAPTNQGVSGGYCILSPPGNHYPTTAGTYQETITFTSQGLPNKTATIYLLLTTTPTPTPIPTPSPITVTGHVHYCETDSGLQGVTISISSPINQIKITDVNGNYTFQAPPGSIYTITASKTTLKPGNMLISTIDIITLLNAYLTNTPLLCPRSGDVNGDGQANTIDIIPIQRFVLGQSSPPVGRYTFSPVIPLATDFNTILIGDVK